jgi:ABC-type spermidine/putrescine transport system permease subunit I
MNIVANNHLEGVNSKALAKARRKEGRLFFNLSLPSLITILIVVFIPVFWLSSLSFFDRAGDFSWENYDRIFQSQLYIKTFIVTLKISFITLFFCILLGYPLCYWIGRNSYGFCFVTVLDFNSCSNICLAGYSSTQWNY